VDAIGELQHKLVDFRRKALVRDLIVNIVVLTGCGLLQAYFLFTQGPSHAAWIVYVGATLGLVVVAWLSLLFACLNWVTQAANLYAWSLMVAVLAMVVSGMQPNDDLPALSLFLICAGASWLYKTLNWPSALAYSIVALIAFNLLGVAYGQVDDSVVASLLLICGYGLGEHLWQNTVVRFALGSGW
jgi:hypothetical protein